eukprot:TRINITY_DN405_c0_g1_i3.p1 TRINITY_DN405_c0_g1~~TRINITY_DN405_c0_g1_i3.p1  ORF type:complete len:286 (+),score=98.07 TRINITY_DN405_c0_g1_i3:265-1122(+)
MRLLVQHSDLLDEKFETRISPALERSKQAINNLTDDMTPLSRSLVNHISQLWADPGIQRTFECRAIFHLPDSAKYFLDKLDEVSQENYLPTYNDVLRVRVRTTGVVQNNFLISKHRFEVYDVGGQKSERKKWIHLFEGVTAVIFVAAISEYDQTMWEDNHTNRMEEALNLFEEICNSPFFQQTSMILFLNKTDLFDEKIRRVPLSVCFEEYQGELGDVESAKAHIKMQFVRRSAAHTQNNSQGASMKEVYTHFTQATDTDQIAHVLAAVQDIILKGSLRAGGLLV